jgi:hypothetical protein
MKRLGRYILFLAALLGCARLQAQDATVTFGKNVIQYTDFDWAYYNTDNYDVYFYQGGKELARFILNNGDKYLKEMQSKLDYPLDDKISFIVYNSYTDYRQSNYHANTDAVNLSGKSHVAGNKAFIYFNGSHLDFERQIRSAIAQILLQDLFYGGNIQERLQSNLLLNLPDWYSEGLIRYLSADWNADYESQLRNGIMSGKFKKFKNITDEQAAIISESLWQYVAQQYSPEAVANIVYIMRANKSIESGYLFVIGKNFQTLYNEWYQYHYMRYDSFNVRPKGEEITQLKKVFKKGTVTRIVLSQHDEYAGVVTNDHGKAKVWVVNTVTGKKKRIYKEGYRRDGNLFDYNYPVIAWNTRQNILTVIYEKGVTPTYIQYNADEKKTEKPQMMTRIDRVLSCQYNENGHTSVMSVVRHGQTDVITFDFHNQIQRNITDDIYDDLEPRFARDGKDIVLTSNRPTTSLSHVTSNTEFSFNSNWDIFYLKNFEQRAGYNLKRITSAPSNEFIPDSYDTTFLSYVTDENGYANRNAARLDSIFSYTRLIAKFRDTSVHKNDTLKFLTKDKSAINIPATLLADTNVERIDTAFIYRDTVYTYAMTNYGNNILQYVIQRKSGFIYELMNSEGRYHLYKLPLPKNIPANAIKRPIPQMPQAQKPNPENSFIIPGKTFQPNEPLTESTPENKDTGSQKPYFQTDFPKHVSEMEANTGYNPLGSNSMVKMSNGRIRYASASPYELLFKVDNVSTELDNGLLNSPYVPYHPGDNTVYNPTLNGMMKFGMSDLFRDYRVVAGFRMLATFTGAEYFMLFDNLKKRLDKRTMFFRRGEVDYDGIGYERVTSTELREELRWPFSETTSIRGAVFGRLDNTVYLTTNETTLKKPSLPSYWSGVKGEYVFDNTIPNSLNLMYGTRAKVYTEFFDAVNRPHTLFTVVGTDLRHYVKLPRQLVWANRFSSASSIGPAKVVYFLGGVDNWLFPRFNQNNLVDPSQNYVYKALAAPMRGFDQNVRNGSSYALLNSELRMPLFRFIFNRPFGNPFLQNFQLIGFADAGTAWDGLNPFSANNAYEKHIYQTSSSNGPIFDITVSNMRDPIVLGYGFGFRTLLFGYFFRLDFANGLENGEKQPRKIYFSIGTDF